MENVVSSKITSEQVAPNPANILQVGLGFWASKTFLAAAKLQLFTLVAPQPLSAETIRQKLNLHGHGLQDWLDALTSLGFLQRQGMGAAATYGNTPETAFFMDKNQPFYIGGFFEMANDREYRFWADLEEGLRTGKPQNEIKTTGLESFRAIYQDEDNAKQFTEAMTGIQLGSFMSFSQKYDFSRHQQMVDVGGSGAALSAIVAQAHKHMRAISLDLPHVEKLAKENTRRFGVADRVNIQSGDFFAEPLPKADLITMGNILHSFDMEKKQQLLRKAYEALPEGGVLAVIELIMDNERRHNTFALLMSLNMLIESDGGFNYTQADLTQWSREAGFRSVEFMSLDGPVTAAIIRK